ncbi:unnamed protein product [Moneuplotes crassus]|uniref:MORN repeat protein n=1 Tax=Euplotes crassus TaxID=5936 RepID=A0AAD1XVU3_EUPCR|nr:unnamed protein product [Moneuplotes crassus]
MDKNNSLIREAQKKLELSGKNFVDVLLMNEGDSINTIRIVAPGKSSGTSGISPSKYSSGYTYYKIKSDIITLEDKTETYTNGDTYEGEIKASTGKKHGTGTYKWKDGRMYVGDWVDGVKEGKGNHYWPHGDQYEGEWKNDKRHGQGVLSWRDGETRTGRWLDGRQNGHGVNTYPNGDRYEGNFENGKKNGYGVMHYKNGGKWEGQWKDGEKDDKEENFCIIF